MLDRSGLSPGKSESASRLDTKIRKCVSLGLEDTEHLFYAAPGPLTDLASIRELYVSTEDLKTPEAMTC